MQSRTPHGQRVLNTGQGVPAIGIPESDRNTGVASRQESATGPSASARIRLPYRGPNKTVLAAVRYLTHVGWYYQQATRSETVNHRRIRRIFTALAVLGVTAAGAAAAYAGFFCDGYGCP